MSTKPHALQTMMMMMMHCNKLQHHARNKGQPGHHQPQRAAKIMMIKCSFVQRHVPPPWPIPRSRD
jgi:hypothetical protein